MSIQKGYADLHVHTTMSDGIWTPAEVVRMAKDAGLKAVGIADHDTVDGLVPAFTAAADYGVEIVPGIEINTDYRERGIHILGYYFDLDNNTLAAQLARIRQARRERVADMVQKLQSAGIRISDEQVLRLAGPGTVGRPHVARALIALGLASSVQDAFNRFLLRGRPGYVERYKITPAEAICIIRQSRGIPVLAHPGSAGLDEIIPELISCGLLGLEVYHPEHNVTAARRYACLARAYGLLITGGSDAHGPDYRCPTQVGSYRIPYEYVPALQKKKKEIEAGPPFLPPLPVGEEYFT